MLHNVFAIYVPIIKKLCNVTDFLVSPYFDMMSKNPLRNHGSVGDFFGDELRQVNYIHFLKADCM